VLFIFPCIFSVLFAIATYRQLKRQLPSRVIITSADLAGKCTSALSLTVVLIVQKL